MTKIFAVGVSLTIPAMAGLLSVGTPAFAAQLTTDQIVQLASAGLGDEAIIAKIKSAGQPFDLSVSQMVDLKQRGVSGAVIAAMLSIPPSAGPVMSTTSANPMVSHPAGVYLLVQGAPAVMQRLDATVTNQAKTGGIWGYALTAGIASASVKAAIQNETARVSVGDPSPVFFFFFDESNPETSRQNVAWTSGSAATVTSPNEFTLIRLNRKDGRREARVGSMNIGGAKTGVMDSDRIPFQYDLMRPGVYRVSPAEPLDSGEYGFIYSLAGGGAAGALSARIFDFAVKPVETIVAPATLQPQWRQASYSPGISVAFIDAASIHKSAQAVSFSTMLYYQPEQGSDHYKAQREAHCADRTFRDVGRAYYLGKAVVSTVGEDKQTVHASPGTVNDEMIVAACDPRKLGKAFEDPDAAAAIFFAEPTR